MESIFLILSGVILAAGILYWLWSHIQLTQKKTQLLENSLFELRGMLTVRGPGPPPASAEVVAAAPAGPVAPVYADLADDDWEEPEPKPTGANTVDVIREGTVEEDLQPGGRILVPTEAEEVAEEKSSEEFRELFLKDTGAPVTAAAAPQSLESMPVKELRRLAEQRGITGVAELRKKELLAALRQQVAPAVVEKTLDLTVEHADTEDAPVDAETIPLE